MYPRIGIRGFTLIELLMVVAIIAVLLAIAVPNVITAREQSQANGCISNLHEIDSAKEMLRVDLHLSASATPTSAEMVPIYLRAFPVCPSGGTYSINPLGQNPTCTIGGPFPHIMTPD